MRSIVIALTALALFVAVSAYLVFGGMPDGRGGDRAASGMLSDVPVRSSIAATVPLIDSAGRTTSLGTLQKTAAGPGSGPWLVVFFGYTSCPDVCPLDLAYLKKEFQAMGSAAADVRGVFVSVDPARDTPAVLDKYVHYFNPQFIGLTGDPAQLRLLARDLGAYYEIQSSAPKAAGGDAGTSTAGAGPNSGNGARPAGSYTVAHSAAFFLVSPDGQLAGVLQPPFAPGDLGTKLALLRTVAPAEHALAVAKAVAGSGADVMKSGDDTAGASGAVDAAGDSRPGTLKHAIGSWLERFRHRGPVADGGR